MSKTKKIVFVLYMGAVGAMVCIAPNLRRENVSLLICDTILGAIGQVTFLWASGFFRYFFSIVDNQKSTTEKITNSREPLRIATDYSKVQNDPETLKHFKSGTSNSKLLSINMKIVSEAGIKFITAQASFSVSDGTLSTLNIFLNKETAVSFDTKGKPFMIKWFRVSLHEIKLSRFDVSDKLNEMGFTGFTMSKLYGVGEDYFADIRW